MYEITESKYASIKSSFLRRVFIIFLVIIIAFTSSFKPQETKAEAVTFLTIAAVAGFILTCTGIVINADEIKERLFGSDDVSDDEVLDYFNRNVSVDGDGNYIISDDAQLTINQMMEDYDKAVTMMYRYPVRPEQLDATWFSSKAGYDALVSAITNHPELYFYIAGTTNSHNIIDFYVFSSDALSSVNANFDLIYANCALYNSEWGQDFDIYHCRMVDGNTTFQCVGANPSNIKTFDTFDELLACDWNYSTSVASATLMRADNLEWVITQAKWLVSSKPGAINCYKSADDMKKDLDSQVIGKYTPDYTGAPNYNIDQSTVNNNINNYYGDDSGGGSGSGSDDSGSSSGIFGGLAKIVGALVNGIASIIDAIVAPIERIISSIVGLFKDFIDAIMSFADLYDSNIPLFFKDVFSFLPDKLVTVLTTSLILVIIVAVIKFLRG